MTRLLVLHYHIEQHLLQFSEGYPVVAVVLQHLPHYLSYITVLHPIDQLC